VPANLRRLKRSWRKAEVGEQRPATTDAREHDPETRMPDWLASRFSLLGLIAVVLQQIPGIVWAIRPPKVDPFARNSGSFVVELLEKTFGISTLLLLVVVVSSTPLIPTLGAISLWSAFVVLAAYYGFYVAYYLGLTSLTVLLGMAALPPMCFVLVAIHQGNSLALATGLAFGVVHIGLTYSNFAPRR
jgi:hypothetical protein